MSFEFAFRNLAFLKAVWRVLNFTRFTALEFTDDKSTRSNNDQAPRHR